VQDSSPPKLAPQFSCEFVVWFVSRLQQTHTKSTNNSEFWQSPSTLRFGD
jgi:hypothetical protein